MKNFLINKLFFFFHKSIFINYPFFLNKNYREKSIYNKNFLKTVIDFSKDGEIIISEFMDLILIFYL